MSSILPSYGVKLKNFKIENAIRLGNENDERLISDFVFTKL